MNYNNEYLHSLFTSVNDNVKNEIIDILLSYKKGGSIHIKKKNRGKFTAAAKLAGKGVQEYARDVLSNPNSTPLQRKRANFAINAKKFKH